ncbi:MAG: M23 family metallopeptidase [Fibrobacter sp.]|nr:M23 family metallopeptidase [Fibrobacter sp.]
MSVEFQEYKGRRKKIKTQHKFPLIRLLLVAVAAFLAYWSGLAQKIADALPLPGNEEVVVVDNWESRCKSHGGTPFALEHGLAQCSWILNDSTFVERLPNTFLRYVASLRHSETSKLHWVAPIEDFSNARFVLHEDENKYEYLHLMTKDSSYVWVSKKTGCRFPGICPQLPMEWSALPISDGFDFEGQESLIAMDVFRGIGEAPIQPILPGIILSMGKDSLGYFMEIDHGFNVTSKTSGMGFLKENLMVGDSIKAGTTIGRLSPQDSSAFFLTVRQNGLFVRWNDFYAAAHPVQQNVVAEFEKSLGF